MTESETGRAALDRFAAMLEAYGADPRRWPRDRRAEAEALLARSAAARALAAEAARLDALLDAAPVEPAPAHLVGRVLAAAPKPRASAGWLAGLLKPALGIGLAAFLGLGLGGVISPFGPPAGEVAESEAVAITLGIDPEMEL